MPFALILPKLGNFLSQEVDTQAWHHGYLHAASTEDLKDHPRWMSFVKRLKKLKSKPFKWKCFRLAAFTLNQILTQKRKKKKKKNLILIISKRSYNFVFIL